jgi:hypothetical protein
MISFSVTKADSLKIEAIVKRAAALSRSIDRMSLDMDLTACHANGTPLNLDALLAADDFNFAHDVLGIQRHMDRDDASPTAGRCLNCFVPRFAL